MTPTLTRQGISQSVVEEIQRAITEDQNFRYWLVGLLNESFPSRMEIQQLYEAIDRQIAAYREESERRLEAFRQEMAALREDFNRRMDEHRSEFRREMAALREDFNRRMEEQREDFNRRMEEQREDFNRRMEEQREDFNRRMEEQRSEFRQEMAALREDFNRHVEQVAAMRENFNQRMDEHGRRLEDAIGRMDATLGAMGARWGMMAEEAFRDGMAGILKKRLGWEVERFLVRDTEGFVFGHPDQVEIDVVIHNGFHWLVEVRSSVSVSDMYTFARKVAFYERLRGVQAERLIVVSPMVHPRARDVAQKLGIEVYSSVYDVS